LAGGISGPCYSDCPNESEAYAVAAVIGVATAVGVRLFTKADR
jgi:hypothetical protein